MIRNEEARKPLSFTDRRPHVAADDPWGPAEPRTIVRRLLKSVFDLVENDPAQRELVRHWHRPGTSTADPLLAHKCPLHDLTVLVPCSPATQPRASVVAAINMRLAELPNDEERANKELDRTAGALVTGTAPPAGQFRRSADNKELPE